jgi:GNAT superfamily N-acetyltransferase
MIFDVSPFNIHLLGQLVELPPREWQSNAYELFLYNDWQPWFYPYQVIIDNKLVGFGMFFLFEKNAWLGWIIVHKKFRNQGIGSAITKHLCEQAREMGAKNFILTATELGMPIYEKLGFKTTSYYRFFNSPELYKPQYDKSTIRNANKNDLETILQLDFEATGERRAKLIESHLEDCMVIYTKEISGFYMPNLGNGFIVARDNHSGQELLNFRLKRNNKTIALPDQNITAIEYLLKNGFTEGHKTPRMVLGSEPLWNPAMIFCRAAGYCG